MAADEVIGAVLPLPGEMQTDPDQQRQISADQRIIHPVQAALFDPVAGKTHQRFPGLPRSEKQHARLADVSSPRPGQHPGEFGGALRHRRLRRQRHFKKAVGHIAVNQHRIPHRSGSEQRGEGIRGRRAPQSGKAIVGHTEPEAAGTAERRRSGRTLPPPRILPAAGFQAPDRA